MIALLDIALKDEDARGKLSIIGGYLEEAARFTGLTPVQCAYLAGRLEAIRTELGRSGHDGRDDGAANTAAQTAGHAAGDHRRDAALIPPGA